MKRLLQKPRRRILKLRYRMIRNKMKIQSNSKLNKENKLKKKSISQISRRRKRRKWCKFL